MVDSNVKLSKPLKSEPNLSTEDVCLSFKTEDDEPFFGLSHLENSSNLFIKKEIRLGLAQTEIATLIFNERNEKIYYAKELVDDGCFGCCYSPDILFDMKVFDSLNNEVLYLARERQFQCSRITRRSPILEVFTSTKHKIGSMKGVISFCRIKYNVEDGAGRCILKIRNVIGFPYAHFKILSRDKSTTIGKIMRERTKTQNVLSKNCSVKVTFPIDLEVKIKAVLLCAALTLVCMNRLK